jgi:hypothetical protein
MAALQILAIPSGLAAVYALLCTQIASPASARLFTDQLLMAVLSQSRHVLCLECDAVLPVNPLESR